MPRPSKLPAFRKHLLGRGYSLATINVYVWAAAATLDAVLDLSDENLRAFFQTFEPAKRATYRAAWRALCEQRRETDGVDTPRGDPLPPDASAEAVAAVPALVAQTARALRAQEVSGRKALTLLVGDVRRFGEQAVIDLRHARHGAGRRSPRVGVPRRRRAAGGPALRYAGISAAVAVWCSSVSTSAIRVKWKPPPVMGNR